MPLLFLFQSFCGILARLEPCLRLYNSLHPLGQDRNLCEKPESFQAFAGRKRAYCKRRSGKNTRCIPAEKGNSSGGFL
ncbi:hypothetical protein D1841_05115 [Neglecta sp. X4]|nr:hypothetical protein [Neglectibacter sp. 59]NBJ72707.1 hypothetical protein [Neglectibacter sp. X4]NCE80313.1 hypothetical protein [Neglectibacter sp. X58]